MSGSDIPVIKCTVGIFGHYHSETTLKACLDSCVNAVFRLQTDNNRRIILILRIA